MRMHSLGGCRSSSEALFRAGWVESCPFSHRHPFLQNYPLYIRSTPTENELKFHYMVHTSLDVVDEKISAMGKALVDQRELYLGLLYPTEDYKVYLSVQGVRQGGPTVGCTLGSDHVKLLRRKKRVRARRGPSAARCLTCCPGSPSVTSTFPNQLCRYGYVTNSKVKFVMVVDSSNTALRDNEIRSMFRKLHNSYTDVMCNPFYNPGDRIQSRCSAHKVDDSSVCGAHLASHMCPVGTWGTCRTQ
ncbi:Trafficking protein particle complex subunit 2-like protein [Plecturocebus cupreus]